MATYTLHAVYPFLFLIFPARGPLSLVCMFISSSQEGASNDIERTLLQCVLSITFLHVIKIDIIMHMDQTLQWKV